MKHEHGVAHHNISTIQQVTTHMNILDSHPSSAKMESRLQIGMLALLPYACIGAIIQYCHKNKDCSLGDQLEVTPLQRKALLVHLAYFIGVPIMIEVFPDLHIIDALVVRRIPPSQQPMYSSCSPVWQQKTSSSHLQRWA